MLTDPITLGVLIGNRYDPNNVIYARTNENLTKLLTHYNVKDKDVLTVLGSSDQVLSCYYHKAKTIDTFDRAYITLYYYYLRKWLILYRKQLYPSNKFYFKSDASLYDMIKIITPDNKYEEDAKIFWLIYLKRNNYTAGKNLFEGLFSSKGTIPFKRKINSIKGIYDNDLNFYCFDITNPINLNKKYDVLILSNILEYFDNRDKKIIVRNNIENLLNDNGIAICSYKLYNANKKEHIAEVNLLTENKLVLNDEYENIAYSYRKK